MIFIPSVIFFFFYCRLFGMQTAPFRIWTWTTDSILFSDNLYAKPTSSTWVALIEYSCPHSEASTLRLIVIHYIKAP